MLDQVKTAPQKTIPGDTLLLPDLYYYYEMKLVSLVEGWYSLEQYIGLK